jgi:hypothetical protein
MLLKPLSSTKELRELIHPYNPIILSFLHIDILYTCRLIARPSLLVELIITMTAVVDNPDA